MVTKGRALNRSLVERDFVLLLPDAIHAVWYGRGDMSDARNVLRRVRRYIRTTGRLSELAVEIACGLARLHEQKGTSVSCRLACWREALSGFAAAGAEVDAALCRYAMAWCFVDLGRPEAAQSSLQELLASTKDQRLGQVVKLAQALLCTLSGDVMRSEVVCRQLDGSDDLAAEHQVDLLYIRAENARLAGTLQVARTYAVKAFEVAGGEAVVKQDAPGQNGGTMTQLLRIQRYQRQLRRGQLAPCKREKALQSQGQQLQSLDGASIFQRHLSDQLRLKAGLL